MQRCFSCYLTVVQRCRIISQRHADHSYLHWLPPPTHLGSFWCAARKKKIFDHLHFQPGCHKLFRYVCIKMSLFYLLFCQPSTRHMSFVLHFIPKSVWFNLCPWQIFRKQTVCLKYKKLTFSLTHIHTHTHILFFNIYKPLSALQFVVTGFF